MVSAVPTVEADGKNQELHLPNVFLSPLWSHTQFVYVADFEIVIDRPRDFPFHVKALFVQLLLE